VRSRWLPGWVRCLARGGVSAGFAVAGLLALSGCGGSGGQAPAATTPLAADQVAATNAAPSAGPGATMITASCQRPDDTMRNSLAARLADGVEVQHAALLRTRVTLHDAPVYYLAGVVFRDSTRVGTAVWASYSPSTTGAWTAVDATASLASHVLSAAGTPAELSRNVAAYTRVSSCATLGF
jgi:hypothetical protein